MKRLARRLKIIMGDLHVICRRCGCYRARHTHYRKGTDCGECGAKKCRRFK